MQRLVESRLQVEKIKQVSIMKQEHENREVALLDKVDQDLKKLKVIYFKLIIFNRKVKFNKLKNLLMIALIVRRISQI